ncbi:glycosyltransferase [Thalassorhabdomicrobium marinisediminis]|uniref:glycosyltransferase n=1 Tax=Thalassorhabdomicrobium marinisediminis TaxID=2170577 RepID=UPI0024910489|nr:glycosyltransferase [Thalassorhabdomicrobium marinisediminis]
MSEAARLLTEALTADGRFLPVIVTLQDSDFDADRAAWPNVPIHAFRAYGPANYGFSPGMFWFVMRQRAQCVHVHGIWMFHVFCAAVWSSFYRRPALVTPHGMLEYWIRQRSARLKAAVSLLYQRRFLSRASLHVLTSNEIKDVSDAGIPTGRCTVIPNYVHTPKINFGKPDWWQPEFADRRIYLFFGRIHDKKGWEELCYAWRQLNDTQPRWQAEAQLVFCGWLDDCSNFERTLRVLQEEFGNIVFAGSQFGGDRDKSYAAADFFVLPSKSEGLPMSILEAWAFGVPTIMTRACNLDIGYSSEAALETGEEAYQIARTLAEAQTMPGRRRQKMRNAAINLVKESFSQNAVGSSYANLLASLVEKGARDSDVVPSELL